MESSTLFNDHNDLLLLLYKICSPICFFLNLLAMYLIIFESSREMKTYRWHLLHYQIWASAIDIFINFLYQPVLFFPLIAVTGHGFLIMNLGIPTFICFGLFDTLMFGLGVSIMELFFYRHQCIVGSKLTQMQLCFCIFLYLFVSSFIINAIYRLLYTDPSQWSETLEKLSF